MKKWLSFVMAFVLVVTGSLPLVPPASAQPSFAYPVSVPSQQLTDQGLFRTRVVPVSYTHLTLPTTPYV